MFKKVLPLVVGQKIRVRSRGVTIGFGNVVRIMPDRVVVREEYGLGKLVRFDNDGKGWCDGDGSYEYGPMLDVRTLVVGQEVHVTCGVYGDKGRVISD